ncbi:unnamed protein product [Brassica oleracea]
MKIELVVKGRRRRRMVDGRMTLLVFVVLVSVSLYRSCCLPNSLSSILPH